MASIYTFKDGKLMYRDKIAYANGDYVSLKDYKALERKAEKIKESAQHPDQSTGVQVSAVLSEAETDSYLVAAGQSGKGL